MPNHDDSVPTPPPAWATQQASTELSDVHDPEGVLERAHQIAREAQELDDERHDEYDDPDQGGES